MTNVERRFVEDQAAEFERAFLVTGLIPVRNSYGDGNRTGCAVTAFTVAVTGFIGDDREPEHCGGFARELLRAHATAPRKWMGLLPDRHWDWDEYVSGVMGGFDRGGGNAGAAFSAGVGRSFVLGFAAGSILASRIFSKPLPERKAIPEKVAA